METRHSRSNYSFYLTAEEVPRLDDGFLETQLLDSRGMRLPQRVRLQFKELNRDGARFSLYPQEACWEDAKIIDITLNRPYLREVRMSGRCSTNWRYGQISVEVK